MPSDNGQQVEILRMIWEEMKAVKASLEKQLTATREELGARIDQTNARIGQTNKGLESLAQQTDENFKVLTGRITESEMRLATATTELAADVHVLSDLIRDWRQEHREDRARLERRVTRIEAHIGLAPS